MDTVQNKIRLFSVLVLSLLFVIFSLNCSEENSSTTTNTDPNAITIQGNAFQPAALTVKKGTTVTWTNKDSYAHTVTSGISPNPNGTFNSNNVSANQTFSFKFDNTGSFDYFCMIHPFMKAKITVEE
ncbi:MAG: cupredoxin family copper-binding protein [Ignavibacteriales bacterium]|nr:cupredoxin family copper-binding protein [Ignavibacteriales bacterium]